MLLVPHIDLSINQSSINHQSFKSLGWLRWLPCSPFWVWRVRPFCCPTWIYQLINQSVKSTSNKGSTSIESNERLPPSAGLLQLWTHALWLKPNMRLPPMLLLVLPEVVEGGRCVGGAPLACMHALQQGSFNADWLAFLSCRPCNTSNAWVCFSSHSIKK